MNPINSTRKILSVSYLVYTLVKQTNKPKNHTRKRMKLIITSRENGERKFLPKMDP